jgi:hypothetical protein
LKNLFGAVAYQWRQAAREYVLDPIQSATLGDALLLSNSSRSRCREFEVTTRYTFRRTDELKVLCAFEGDRNDFNSYYGNLIVGAFSDRHVKKQNARGFQIVAIVKGRSAFGSAILFRRRVTFIEAVDH